MKWLEQPPGLVVPQQCKEARENPGLSGSWLTACNWIN